MKCDKCEQEYKLLFPDMGYYNWLKVLNYLEIELTQGDITQATHDVLIDALMYLKPDEQPVNG